MFVRSKLTKGLTHNGKVNLTHAHTHRKHSDAQSYLSIHRFNLLKRGKNKHSSLAHTRLGLTKNVHAQNCLWDAFMLNCKTKEKK